MGSGRIHCNRSRLINGKRVGSKVGMPLKVFDEMFVLFHVTARVVLYVVLEEFIICA